MYNQIFLYFISFVEIYAALWEVKPNLTEITNSMPFILNEISIQFENSNLLTFFLFLKFSNDHFVYILIRILLGFFFCIALISSLKTLLFSFFWHMYCRGEIMKPRTS
jgi:hypothetical protein